VKGIQDWIKILFHQYKAIKICLVEKNGSVIKSLPTNGKKDYARIATKRNNFVDFGIH
jgi:hypothetical protein